MNIFKSIKQSVTAKQVAESYGVRPVKNGLAPCPFFWDRRPSLKLDNNICGSQTRIHLRISLKTAG